MWFSSYASGQTDTQTHRQSETDKHTNRHTHHNISQSYCGKVQLAVPSVSFCAFYHEQQYFSSLSFRICSVVIISHVVLQSVERKWVLEQTCRLSHLSVCPSVGLSVQWVNCGKMVYFIWMPFRMVSRVGRRMGVLDGVEIVKGKAQFGGKCGASQCNQWRLCGIVILCHKGVATRLFPNYFGICCSSSVDASVMCLFNACRHSAGTRPNSSRDTFVG